jgi:hypothetical protein
LLELEKVEGDEKRRRAPVSTGMVAERVGAMVEDV